MLNKFKDSGEIIERVTYCLVSQLESQEESVASVACVIKGGCY